MRIKVTLGPPKITRSSVKKVVTVEAIDDGPEPRKAKGKAVVSGPRKPPDPKRPG